MYLYSGIYYDVSVLFRNILIICICIYLFTKPDFESLIYKVDFVLV